MARRIWMQLAVAAVLAYFFIPPALSEAPFMLGQSAFPSFIWLLIGAGVFAGIGVAFGWWGLPMKAETKDEEGTPLAFVYEPFKKYLYRASNGAYFRDFRAWILNADTNFKGRRGARLIATFPLREFRLDPTLLLTAAYTKQNKMSRDEVIEYICNECSNAQLGLHHPSDFAEHVVFLERKPTIRTIEQAKAMGIERLIDEERYEDIPAVARGGGDRYVR